MLEEGGIALNGGKIDLRFPTLAMAEAAHQRLCERLPLGDWTMSWNGAPATRSPLLENSLAEASTDDFP